MPHRCASCHATRCSISSRRRRPIMPSPFGGPLQVPRPLAAHPRAHRRGRPPPQRPELSRICGRLCRTPHSSIPTSWPQRATKDKSCRFCRRFSRRRTLRGHRSGVSGGAASSASMAPPAWRPWSTWTPARITLAAVMWPSKLLMWSTTRMPKSMQSTQIYTILYIYSTGIYIYIYIPMNLPQSVTPASHKKEYKMSEWLERNKKYRKHNVIFSGYAMNWGDLRIYLIS